MGTISDYLENAWLDHIFENTEFSVPSNIYICLSSTDPTDDGSGLSEPSGNGYSRVPHPFWNTAESRSISNDGEVEFPIATGPWGTVTHYAIMDAETGGNLLAYGALSIRKTIYSGNTLSIGDEEMSISVTPYGGWGDVSGGFSNYLVLKMLDHTFMVSAYIQPTLYIGFSGSDPDDVGNITEPSGNNYARAAGGAWDAATSGTTQNTDTITFNVPSGYWITSVYTVVFDALTGGNYLARGDIYGFGAGLGDKISFPAGDFNITLE